MEMILVVSVRLDNNRNIVQVYGSRNANKLSRPLVNMYLLCSYSFLSSLNQAYLDWHSKNWQALH